MYIYIYDLQRGTLEVRRVLRSQVVDLRERSGSKFKTILMN